MPSRVYRFSVAQNYPSPLGPLVHGGGSHPPPSTSAYLREDGSYILREDASHILREGTSGPSGSTFLLEDNSSRLLLEDGTYLLME